MPGYVSTVTSKGQLTIPKPVRETLSLREHDQLLFVLEDEHVVLIPLRKRPLSELYGALPATRSYPGHQEIRDEVRAQLGERIERGDE